MKYLITGASSGIGKRLSERLLNSGHECILIARSKDKLDEIVKNHRGGYAIQADLSKINLISSIFDGVKELYPLDGIIHCAGIAPLKRIDENDIDMVKETYTINVFSFIELMRCFVQDGVCKNGASVVVMSSVVGQRGSNRQSVYSGTKAALDATARCMSNELKDRKIRVNTLVSGPVETEMFLKLKEESHNFNEKFKTQYPLGIVPIDEVCDMIEFLLSDSASHITGTSIPIDSGYLL